MCELKKAQMTHKKQFFPHLSFQFIVAKMRTDLPPTPKISRSHLSGCQPATQGPAGLWGWWCLASLIRCHICTLTHKDIQPCYIPIFLLLARSFGCLLHPFLCFLYLSLSPVHRLGPLPPFLFLFHVGKPATRRLGDVVRQSSSASF